MYYIVEFLEEKTVAVVPNTWMDTLETCRWPPTTQEFNKKLTKLVKLKSQPEDCFGTYDVRILGSSDELERANFKAQKARETSDINTTDTDGKTEAAGRPKRINRKRKTWSSSSEDDSSHQEEEIRYISPPEPPALMERSEALQLDQILESNMLTPRVELQTASSSQSMANLEKQSVLLERENYTCSPLGRPVALENISTAGMSVEALFQLNAEFHKQILRKLKLIEAEQRQQRDFINQTVNGSYQQYRLPRLPFSLPVNSEDELIALEQFLKIETNQDIMIRHLKLVGGAQFDIAIRGILSRCMTFKVASNFTYKGLRNKMQFRSLKLQKVVFGATQLLYPEVTEAQFSKIVGDWLRYSPRQKGGSKYCGAKTALRMDAIDASIGEELDIDSYL